MYGCYVRNKVHITQGDLKGKAVIVSWVTVDEPGLSTVRYWSENSKQKKLAEGKFVTYRFFNYTSGFIHHCTIRDLEVLLYSIASRLCCCSSSMKLMKEKKKCHLHYQSIVDICASFLGSTTPNITMKLEL